MIVRAHSTASNPVILRTRGVSRPPFVTIPIFNRVLFFTFGLYTTELDKHDEGYGALLNHLVSGSARIVCAQNTGPPVYHAATLRTFTNIRTPPVHLPTGPARVSDLIAPPENPGPDLEGNLTARCTIS